MCGLDLAQTLLGGAVMTEGAEMEWGRTRVAGSCRLLGSKSREKPQVTRVFDGLLGIKRQ